MAKELPYFKFNSSEWISGEITLEPLDVQGAFINICAYYWFKSGSITLTEINRRLKLKQATINRLLDGNHIKLNGDLIEITFLREQFDERGMISKRNSANGKKGGAPKGNKNAKIKAETKEITSENNQEQAKTTNIEKEREEEKEKNEIINIGTGEFFVVIEKKYVGSQLIKVKGEDGMNEYYQQNKSILRDSHRARNFLESNNGRHFKDFMHLFNAYNLFLTTNQNGAKKLAFEL